MAAPSGLNGASLAHFIVAVASGKPTKRTEQEEKVSRQIAAWPNGALGALGAPAASSRRVLREGRAGQTGGCLFGSCVCVPLATTFVVVRRPKAVTPRRCIAGASRPMAALRSFRLRKSVERQENGGWVGGFLAGPVPAPSGADCYTAPQRCLASATRWQRCPLPFSVCLSDGRPHRTLRLRIVTQRLRI